MIHFEDCFQTAVFYLFSKSIISCLSLVCRAFITVTMYLVISHGNDYAFHAKNTVTPNPLQQGSIR